MAKIIIADSMQQEVVEKMKELGEVIYKPGNLEQELQDADALVVRSATKVTAELIGKAKQLKVVARAGVGLDNVDIIACQEKGIKVINTPKASTEAVAEITIASMMGVMRRIGFAHESMKKGEWAKKKCIGNEIAGKTLGIIGLGRIGQSVAKKASALGMNVIYNNLHEAQGVPYKRVGLDELLENSDVISLHASASSDGSPLIGKPQFEKMKQGAFIVNFARGSLVDEKALVEALENGKLGGAAIDVYEEEPYTEGKLLKLHNVLLTPHIGASSVEAQARIGEDLIAQLRELL